MVALSSLAVLFTAIGGALAHAEFSVDEAKVRHLGGFINVH